MNKSHVFIPFQIKLINIKEIDDIPSSEEQQAQIQLLLDKNALKILNENFHSKSVENDLLGIYKENLENNVENLNEKIASLDCDFSELKKIDEYNAILKQIYALQRKELFLDECLGEHTVVWWNTNNFLMWRLAQGFEG